MKIVVMSDTHLDCVTDEFKTICAPYCDDADMVIHLGDWVGSTVLDYLEQYPLEAVAGNMDSYDIRGRLPAKKVLYVKNYRIGIIHGWGSAYDLRSRLFKELPNVHAIFFGHTHQAMQVEENGVFWFNPGSVFMGRGNHRRSVGIVQIEDHLQAEIVPL